MKKLLLLFSLFVFFQAHAAEKMLFKTNPFSTFRTTLGQETARDSNNKWKDRITFGGTVSANFGTFTFVQINPQIIYKVNPTTWIGAGPNFQYIAGQGYRSTVYGANAFGRKFLSDNLFLQAEYNLLNFLSLAGDRVTGHYGMAGGGYAPTRNVSLMVMYIFTADAYGYLPYGGSPWVIRGGIYF